MLDYFHVANAGWFAISIMTLSTSFISPGFFSRQKGFIYVTIHPISCLESCVSSHLLGIYGGTRDKNMGFLSGGDDLKKINAMLRGKAERQALPCLHSPGGATNLRKFKKI